MKKKVTSALLAAAMMTGTFIPAATPTVGHAQTYSTIEQALSQLTPEERRAIQTLSASAASGLQLSPDIDLTSKEEVSVIVEFKNKPAKTAVLLEKLNGKEISITDAQERVEADHAAFRKDFDSLSIKGKMIRSYKQVYNGVAVTLPANQVKHLLQSKAVKSVWENRSVQLDLPPATEEAKATAYTGTHPHTTLGVDKLHQEGLTGKGVKIGVLDSGMDYNHPDLKDAYEGGYDFVDDDSDPMEATYQQWEESGKPKYSGGWPYYTYHGTHVAGIIAGQQKSDAVFATKGVAPDADLFAYRVLGPYGLGWTDDIVGGIEQSVKDKMDIINLSLGNSSNSPFEPLAVAINNAVLAGVTAVLAAGNGGSNLYTVGSPATSPLAITVGSTDTEVALPSFIGTFKVGSQQITTETQYLTTGFGINMRALKGQTLGIVHVNRGTEQDYAGVDVTGKIALVSTGGNTLQEKVLLAKAKGAKAIFIYRETDNGYVADTLLELPEHIPSQIIKGEQGRAFKSMLQAGEGTFTFDQVKERVLTSDDKLSFYSSRGPARSTYDIKPEIVAPGGNIMSTVPSYHWGKGYIGDYKLAYDQLSGTSMATPHVAGIAALLLQANPKQSPSDIKSALMNTADALKSQNSVYEIGAGRVDAYEAAHANAAFTIADETFTIGSNHKERLIKEITGALSYGTFFDTGAVIEAERTISIENNSEEDKTYKVKVNYQALKGSLPAEENGVVLETTSSVTVKAGSKDGVNAKLHIPITAKNGTYEGYVTFTNINSPDETYQVPFAARKVQEGVAFVNMTDILTTIRNPGDVGNTVMTQLSGSFQLNSHMKSVDTFLTNAEGQDLGFIGSMDGTWIGENTQISLYNVFDGKYYPFTNDKEKPIAYETRVAEPGSYKIKFVFTDDKGKETIIEKPFILDHEAPTVEASLAEGIIEIEPALSTVAFSGNVYDKQIEEAAASGAAVTQGNNKLFIRDQNGYPQQYTLDPSGNFQVNRNFPTYLKVLPLTVFAKDRAGSTSTQKEYFFVRKGTNYISTVANQKDVQSGDSITFTSTIHNSTSWTEAKWTYQFNKNVLTVESIEVPAEWQSQIALEKTETASGITITLKSLDGAIPAADKMPLLQVKAKAKDDKYIDQYVTLTAASPVFTKEDGTKINAGAAQPSVKVQPKHSQLYGDLNGEAIYTRDGFGNLLTTYVDYLALGATVKVKDESGNVYEGKILKDAKFIVDGLPSDRRTLTFELDVPSHFTVQKTVTIGKPNSMPQQQYLTFKPALAGDVNKDNVIDIDDAIYVKEHWSSADRQADINFDGKVDQKDMSYIQANYLLENQMVTPSKKPREKAESKTLSDILSNLQ